MFRLVAVAIGLLPIAAIELGVRFARIAADQPALSQVDSQFGGLNAIDTYPLLDLHALRCQILA